MHEIYVQILRTDHSHQPDSKLHTEKSVILHTDKILYVKSVCKHYLRTNLNPYLIFSM